MLQYSERIISQEPVTEVLSQELSEALSTAHSSMAAVEGLHQDLAPTNSKIDNGSHYAIDLINETQTQLCDLQVLGMSDSGVIEVKRQVACCRYDYPPTDGRPIFSAKPKPKYTRAQIPLTLRSTHDALKRQVDSLSARLARLEAATKITPITNADLRKRGSTLYPQYGDWLLTSDATEQYISFSGLSAEIGRSIYIQTRKRVYLYSNNHSFYGLTAVGNALSSNQWLESKTTYRFVRASSTSWLVTSSSSPYPWV